MNVDNLAAIAALLGVRPAVLVREAQDVLLDAALQQGGNVIPLMPDPGPGSPHPELESVTRWDEDDEAAADESPDEDVLRDEQGE